LLADAPHRSEPRAAWGSSAAKEDAMKLDALGLLKVLLWTVCAFHVAIGLSLNLPPGFKESVATRLYGATVDWSQPQFVYILKPLGAFMMALGVMAAIAARNPLANRAVIQGFVFLFVLRGLQRIVFLREIQDAFAIPLSRHFGTMAFMLLLAAALFILSRSASRSASPAAARA
jgi:hypothetical protein